MGCCRDVALGEEPEELCASVGWLAKHKATVSAITGNIMDKANCIFFIAVSLKGEGFVFNKISASPLPNEQVIDMPLKTHHLRDFAQCKDDRFIENCSSRTSLQNRNVFNLCHGVNKVIPVVLRL